MQSTDRKKKPDLAGFWTLSTWCKYYEYATQPPEGNSDCSCLSVPVPCTYSTSAVFDLRKLIWLKSRRTQRCWVGRYPGFESHGTCFFPLCTGVRVQGPMYTFCITLNYFVLINPYKFSNWTKKLNLFF